MAVITLHPPESMANNIPLGNYINMSTTRSGQLDSAEKLQALIRQAPQGSILATDDETSNTISVYKVGAKPIEEIINQSEYFEKRLEFDKTNYENAGSGISIDEMTNDQWFDLDLSAPGPIGIGTCLIMRVPVTRSDFRYFKMLVQGTVGFDRSEYSYAFGGLQTTLQFEELKPNRIIIPLGIEKAEGGYYFATSEDLPAQHVTAETSELVWSIRPSIGHFHGAAYYLRNFPIVRVDFREFRMKVNGVNRYARQPPVHPQPWIESTLQESAVAQSYMNTTYRVFIRHGIRVSDYTGRVVNPCAQKRSRPQALHLYKYDVYLGDGSELEIRVFDPPIDVEDEL